MYIKWSEVCTSHWNRNCPTYRRYGYGIDCITITVCHYLYLNDRSSFYNVLNQWYKHAALSTPLAKPWISEQALYNIEVLQQSLS